MGTVARCARKWSTGGIGMLRHGRSTGADSFAADLDAEGVVHQQSEPMLLIARRLQQLPLAPAPRFDGAARTAVVVAAAAVAADLRAAGSHAAGTAGSLSQVSATSSGAAGAGGAAASVGVAHALLPVAVGLLATAIGVGGIGIAAERSTPGAPFYAVKTAAEAVALDLTRGASARARAHLGFAAARLQEIAELSRLDPSPATTGRVNQLLTALEGQVGEATGPLLAGSTADQMFLWTAMHQSSAALSALAAHLPASVQPQLNRALAMMAATQGLAAGLPRAHTPIGSASPSTGSGGPGPVPPPGTAAPSLPGAGRAAGAGPHPPAPLSTGAVPGPAKGAPAPLPLPPLRSSAPPPLPSTAQLSPTALAPGPASPPKPPASTGGLNLLDSAPPIPGGLLPDQRPIVP